MYPLVMAPCSCDIVIFLIFLQFKLCMYVASDFYNIIVLKFDVLKASSDVWYDFLFI